MSEINVEEIVGDGIVDAEEAAALRVALYEDDKIDRAEAEKLFTINDEVTGAENSSEYEDLWVEALTDHVLKDDTSPGVLDKDESDWLMGKIKGDGVVDALELRLMVNILKTATEICDEAFIQFTMESAKNSIIDDKKVDAPEVQMLRDIIYGAGGDEGEGVSRAEGDLIFDINDEVTGEDNCPEWKEFAVEALTKCVLEDAVSPGKIDSDEAAWLISRIEGDGEYDDVEKALLTNLKEKATEIDESLVFKIDLIQA